MRFAQLVNYPLPPKIRPHRILKKIAKKLARTELSLYGLNFRSADTVSFPTFLFTPPLRAATTATQKLQAAGGVSIHATRAGSDERKDTPVSCRQVFLCSEHLRSAQDPICLYRSNAVNAVQYVLLYASCTGRQLCFAATQQKSLTFLAA